MNASIVASGVGSVYVIGVENTVAVNLAGTATVNIGADSGVILHSANLWHARCPQGWELTFACTGNAWLPPIRSCVSEWQSCPAENVTITGQATGVNTVSYDMGTCSVSVRSLLNKLCILGSTHIFTAPPEQSLHACQLDVHASPSGTWYSLTQMRHKLDRNSHRPFMCHMPCFLAMSDQSLSYPLSERCADAIPADQPLPAV